MDTNEGASGDENSDVYTVCQFGSGVVIGPVTFSAALLRVTEQVYPLSLSFGKSMSRGDSVTI